MAKAPLMATVVPATSATLGVNNQGIAVDASGNFFIADEAIGEIRKVSAAHRYHHRRRKCPGSQGRPRWMLPGTSLSRILLIL